MFGHYRSVQIFQILKATLVTRHYTVSVTVLKIWSLALCNGWGNKPVKPHQISLLNPKDQNYFMSSLSPLYILQVYQHIFMSLCPPILFLTQVLLLLFKLQHAFLKQGDTIQFQMFVIKTK